MSKPDYITLNTTLQQLITSDQAWHYSIIPKEQTASLICFYTSELNTNDLEDELSVLLGKEISFEQIEDEMLKNTLGRYYRKTQSKQQNLSVGTNDSEDFLRNIIAEAKDIGSSDIHIEIYEAKARLRMRIDGVLVERYTIEKDSYAALINKIKIQSNLDISEKRLPQDGRIFFKEGNQKIDIRVSILPTLYGEKIVMRLLSNDATNIDIQALGLSKNELDNYLEGIKKPNGIILISGPTGSGKTTTLYATLKILNEEKRNVLTIEDPIEYTLDGINQVQLREDIGLTFPSALRSFLRQDPDVIMLGEIRDVETAQMAIRAALTGHLVLSTIHTNSAWGTVSRLIDMGAPPFLLASTLNTTVAQRLVRLLCPNCKKTESFNEKLYPTNYKAPKTLDAHYTAVGCESCYYTGYKGRTALYEVIPVTYDVSEYIKNSTFTISQYLKDQHISTLKDNAFALFEAGKTSIEEVYPLLLNEG